MTPQANHRLAGNNKCSKLYNLGGKVKITTTNTNHRQLVSTPSDAKNCSSDLLNGTLVCTLWDRRAERVFTVNNDGNRKILKRSQNIYGFAGVVAECKNKLHISVCRREICKKKRKEHETENCIVLSGCGGDLAIPNSHSASKGINPSRAKTYIQTNTTKANDAGADTRTNARGFRKNKK